MEYQYDVVFKTIMDQERFEQEAKKLKIDEKHAEIEKKRMISNQNFKLRLLKSCIDVNDWETADEIVNGIYDGRLDLAISQPLLDSISRALNWFLDQMYKPLSLVHSILPNRFGSG